jgi:hypothetical protein
VTANEGDARENDGEVLSHATLWSRLSSVLQASESGHEGMRIIQVPAVPLRLSQPHDKANAIQAAELHPTPSLLRRCFSGQTMDLKCACLNVAMVLHACINIPSKSLHVLSLSSCCHLPCQALRRRLV